MRRPSDDMREVRAPPELLARWALEASAQAQEATWSTLCFLVEVEHAAVTQLPVPAVLRNEKAALDPDGFLRVPRGALEQFRLRSARAMGWMEQLLFFRERFPTAAQRNPPDALYALARLFGGDAGPQDAAVDVLVRESVLPEIEDLLHRTVTYPGLHLMLERMRESDPQRSAQPRSSSGPSGRCSARPSSSVTMAGLAPRKHGVADTAPSTRVKGPPPYSASRAL